MRDFKGDESSVVTEVEIRGFRHNAGLGSFYTFGGTVDGNRLREAVEGTEDVVLGWFAARRGTSLQASMREKAVSLSMAQALHTQQQRPQGAPLYFMVAAWGPAAGGSTFTAMHCLYRLLVPHKGGSTSSGTPVLRPAQLRIRNLGPWRSRGAYEPLTPGLLGPGPADRAPGDPSAGGWEAGDMQTTAGGWDAGDTRATAALLGEPGLRKYLAQVHDMDAVYQEAVQKVHDLHAEDGGRGARLHALQAQVQSLLAGL